MILEVPTRLTPGSTWLNIGSNMTDLRLFLQAYGVNLDDCYEIRFAKRWMKVFRYERDATGHRFIVDNEAARQKPVTFRYRGGLTPLVH